MSEVDNPWGERYYDHFQKFLGDPVERKVFQQNAYTHSIQILTFADVFEGCRAFTSVGLTHYVGEVHRVAEVMLVTDDGWRESPAILANTLFYLAQKSMRLGRGTAVSGIDQLYLQFARTFGKTALYFTLPFALPEEFGTVSDGAEPGVVLLALFISEAEYEFARTQGADKFEDILQAADVDPFSPRRRSTV